MQDTHIKIVAAVPCELLTRISYHVGNVAGDILMICSGPVNI